jgi:hypothetical protein
MRSAVPRAVLVYGLLGVIPFVAPPIAGAVVADWKPEAAVVLARYAALILSFLGGARWGLAIAHPPARTSLISLAMLPSLVGLALLLLPPAARPWQFAGLAAALILHWLWDLRGDSLPAWYPWLRTPLTLGAVAGLVAGAFVLT